MTKTSIGRKTCCYWINIICSKY